jgi:hypothetical protein
MLIGHILGDYYFQNDWIAKNKKDSVLVMILHVIIVSLTMYLLNLVFLQNGYILAVLLIGLTHISIDLISSGLYKKIPWFNNISISPTAIVAILIDQALHIGLILIVASRLDGIETYRRWIYQAGNTSVLFQYPTLFFLLVFMILYLLKPSSYFVDKAIKTVLEIPEEQEDVKKSEMVGYLERLITFVTIISGTYLALTVVIGFKTWSQNKKLQENEHEFTKKYLVGTMMSLLIAIVLALIVRQYLHKEGIIIPQISS